MKKLTLLLIVLLLAVANNMFAQYKGVESVSPVPGTDYVITNGTYYATYSGAMTKNALDDTYLWQIVDAGNNQYYLKANNGQYIQKYDADKAAAGYDGFDMFNYAGFNFSLGTQDNAMPVNITYSDGVCKVQCGQTDNETIQKFYLANQGSPNSQGYDLGMDPWTTGGQDWMFMTYRTWTLTDSVSDLLDNCNTEVFQAGILSGQYKADKVAAFESAKTAAKAVVEGSSVATQNIYNNLKNAYEAVKAAQIPFSGLYRIINAYAAFPEEMGIYVDTSSSSLHWKSVTKEKSNLAFVWEVQPMENGYSIKSLCGDYYMGGVVSSQDAGTTVTSAVANQILTTDSLLNNCVIVKFRLAGAGNQQFYNPKGHSLGAGTSGNIVAWNDQEAQSTWIFEKIEQDDSVFCDTYDYKTAYPNWASTNAGQGGVTSSKTYTFEANKGDLLSFDWTVSSEENNDQYTISVDDSQVVSTSGVNSGKFETGISESGTHKVIAKYMKDADGDAGSDQATISNLTVLKAIPTRNAETYGDWTSTNYHVASSTSDTTYTIKAGKDDIISFDYATSCEEDCDIMSVLIDGATIMEASGKGVTGSKSFTFGANGTYIMKVQYVKDESKNIGDDQVSISNIVLTYAEPKTALKELALSDDLKGFTALKDFEVEALSYERTFNSANTWQALYLPFDLDYSTLADDYDVAELNDVHQWDSDEDGTMDVTKLEVLKVKSGTLSAYTPYVIRAKEAGDKTFSLADANIYQNNDSTFEVMNMKSIFSFKGSCQTVSGTDMYNNKYYALNSGALCQAASTSASLKPFRWYMSVTDRQGNPVSLARVYLTVYGEEDEETETGILELDSTAVPDAPVYDLSGRRITDLRQGGVYIKNGRKFITK